MSAEQLSDQDKVFMAQTLKRRIELAADLTNIGAILDEIFKIAPPLKLEPVEREELERLSGEIRSATASNATRARILGLLAKGLGGGVSDG